MAVSDLTCARLRELLHYDPDTGRFTWRVRKANCVQIGDVAGSSLRNRMVVMIDWRPYGLHRLAFLYMTGAWPKGQVDHIDGDWTNNRWANLRDVSASINQQNKRRAHRNNKTGFLGVCYHKGRFQATIQVAGRSLHLGRFDSAEQAHAAYVEAKRKLHPGGTL